MLLYWMWACTTFRKSLQFKCSMRRIELHWRFVTYLNVRNLCARTYRFAGTYRSRPCRQLFFLLHRCRNSAAFVLYLAVELFDNQVLFLFPFLQVSCNKILLLKWEYVLLCITATMHFPLGVCDLVKIFYHSKCNFILWYWYILIYSTCLGKSIEKPLKITRQECQ